jgi:hypothetical protein
MARDDSSTRNRYGRGSRGRQQQNQGNWQDRYSYGGSRREFESEGGPYRPSWPEQRGSFGEREYGQGEQGGYREDPRQGGYRQGPQVWGGWPEERMGMPYQPYWAPSQWGAGVGFGPRTAERAYDYFYGHDRPAESPEYYEGPRRGEYGAFHGYGHESHAGRGPKGYQRTDDRIHEEICERLTRHPGIDASEIDIKVKEGEVTLSGTVYERRFKHMAEDVADAVSGVKDVKNEIKVDKQHPGFSWEWEQGIDRTGDGKDEQEETTRPRDKSNARR